MDKIEKKVEEINNWADSNGRSVFAMTKEGSKQITIMNASVNELSIMLAVAMQQDKNIARSVVKALDLCEG